MSKVLLVVVVVQVAVQVKGTRQKSQSQRERKKRTRSWVTQEVEVVRQVGLQTVTTQLLHRE